MKDFTGRGKTCGSDKNGFHPFHPTSDPPCLLRRAGPRLPVTHPAFPMFIPKSAQRLTRRPQISKAGPALSPQARDAGGYSRTANPPRQSIPGARTPPRPRRPSHTPPLPESTTILSRPPVIPGRPGAAHHSRSVLLVPFSVPSSARPVPCRYIRRLRLSPHAIPGLLGPTPQITSAFHSSTSRRPPLIAVPPSHPSHATLVPVSGRLRHFQFLSRPCPHSPPGPVLGFKYSKAPKPSALGAFGALDAPTRLPDTNNTGGPVLLRPERLLSLT
jgi:hypothetical protein